MVLHVLIALGREREAELQPPLLAGPGQVPAAGLGVEPVIGGDQERGIGRGGHRLADINPAKKLVREHEDLVVSGGRLYSNGERSDPVFGVEWDSRE